LIQIQTQEIQRIEKIKQKASFFFKNNIYTHISRIPNGVQNGYFNSDLTKDNYYWFTDNSRGRMRVFLYEIFDIKEYGEGLENGSK